MLRESEVFSLIGHFCTGYDYYYSIIRGRGETERFGGRRASEAPLQEGHRKAIQRLSTHDPELDSEKTNSGS